jgi:hypothetical protein
MKKCICCLLFFSFLFSEDIRIDLKNPTLSQKAMSTTEGGIIQSNNFWLQSKHLTYTRQFEEKDVNFVEAEGNFRLDYFNQIFIGDRLEYDFNSKSGIIYNGKTHAGIFYISGERIILGPDGTYTIEKAVLTTCENRKSEWRLKAQRLTIENKQFVVAKDVSFNVVKVPVLWLPRLKATLDSLRHSPIELELGIKEKGGPRLTAKYLVYAWEYSRTYLRLDARLKAGLGVGLESFYKNPDTNTRFIARNYVAKDVRIEDPNKQTRYRIEGLFSHTSNDLTRALDFSYDKLSDIEMPSDYPREAFNEQHPKPTQVLATNRQRQGMLGLFSNIRVNSFQTLSQSLPTFMIEPYPIRLFKKGPLLTLPLQISYLRYQYAKEWQSLLSSFSSARFFFKPQLAHSFNLSLFRLAPKISGVVVGYSNTPQSEEKLFALGLFSLNIGIPLYKTFNSYLHQIEPFATMNHYTHPSTLVDNHFIFDIHDGYTQLQELVVGLKNTFFRPMHTFSFDLFAKSFWQAQAFSKIFPLFGFSMHWQLPKLHLESELLYNLEQNSLNRFTLHTKWTVSKNLALIFEFRRRGKYEFRKVDRALYFLESARPLDDLLASPLSDPSNTILTHLYYRFTPVWTLKMQSRHGFGKDQRDFNDFRVELERFFSCNLKLKFVAQHTQAVKFKAMVSLSIDKKPMRPKFKLKNYKPAF